MDNGLRPHRGWRALIAAAVAAMLGLAAETHAANPDLNLILPRGAQRGTEVEFRFIGGRLKDAAEVIFYDTGVAATAIEAGKDNEATVKMTIAPDAPLGEHRVRLRTASGLTELRTFYVGPFASVEEKEPNSGFDTPQPVELNVTVHGTVENEDDDYYVIEAKAGQRITAEVEGMRLGHRFFDPYVAILDAKRFELASSDDSSLGLQDPVASAIAPADGKYIIQVRESAYGGDGNSRYRLHIGSHPRPVAVFPPGGQVGQSLKALMIGDPTGPFEQDVKLPEQPGPYMLYAQHNGQSVTAPNVMRVSGYPNIIEAEPNNGVAEATATDQPVPLAFNGIIEKDGDADFFKFKATKGQQFHVRVHARSVRSPLDPVLHIFNAQGNAIAGNDDSGGPDSYLQWNVPEDGQYLVRVYDHLGKGGEDFVYRIEFEPLQPGIDVAIPEIDRNRPQVWHELVIHKGNRAAKRIRTTRQNLGGELKLIAESLPAGVTMIAPPVHPNVSEIPVVFEAAADAPHAGARIDLIARPTDENVKVAGSYRQSVTLVQGQPNNTDYYATSVNRLAAAVADEAPFRIQIIEPKVPLVRGGSMGLKVVAERKEGFDNPITVRMLTNPPGVGSSATIEIPKGQTEAYYPLNANGDAALGPWPIAMIATSDVGYGAMEVASQLATIRIAEPYLSVKIEMAAVIQGETAAVLCKIEHAQPFEGEAKIQLHGLPARTATQELTITKETKEVVFNVTTEANSPAGQHKSLFCHVLVPEQGEVIPHNLGGGGVLRIDPPPPPKKDEPAKQPEPQPKPAETKPEAPQPKRLSRLEQLRLEQAERAKKQAEADK